MSRVFITGSSTGLGLMAARLLVETGHQVVRARARPGARCRQRSRRLPGAEAAVVSDLSSIREMRERCRAGNRLGNFDAVIVQCRYWLSGIHGKYDTEDSLQQLLCHQHVWHPYVLTALIERSRSRLGLPEFRHAPQRNAETWRFDMGDAILARSRGVCGEQAGGVLIRFAVARRWPDMLCNALEAWVATRMGGPAAPDDLDAAHRTQVWLAVSERSGRARDRPIFLAHAIPKPNPVVKKQGAAGSAYRGLPTPIGNRPASVISRACSAALEEAMVSTATAHFPHTSADEWQTRCNLAACYRLVDMLGGQTDQHAHHHARAWGRGIIF